jgi:hypothetical protein
VCFCFALHSLSRPPSSYAFSPATILACASATALRADLSRKTHSPLSGLAS